jgi:hypothetical protein
MVAETWGPTKPGCILEVSMRKRWVFQLALAEVAANKGPFKSNTFLTAEFPEPRS